MNINKLKVISKESAILDLVDVALGQKEKLIVFADNESSIDKLIRILKAKYKYAGDQYECRVLDAQKFIAQSESQLLNREDYLNDLRGIPVLNDEEGAFIFHGHLDLPHKNQCKSMGTLVFRDINLAEEASLGHILTLSMDRKLRNYNLPDTWNIILLANDNNFPLKYANLLADFMKFKIG